MLQLSAKGIEDRALWKTAGISLPQYDVAATRKRTLTAPTWLHFGAGNIFRGFLAAKLQTLLNDGLADTGIIAVASAHSQLPDRIYRPYDDLSLVVRMHADGSYEKEVLASIAECIRADYASKDWRHLVELFRAPSLQMVSLTITEKGYALFDTSGTPLPGVQQDLAMGPASPQHTLSIITSLLFQRFQAGGSPIAVVSMDNCSQNGKRLRDAILTIAQKWLGQHFVTEAFIRWLSDEAVVSFPWSMIDKITPHPAQCVQQELTRLGVANMPIIELGKGSVSAPFVNTEVAEYLVLEDSFPNGRPPLEHAGVYFTDRATVEKAEKMKVGTCLNPLHTGLAVFGCLLNFRSIAAEMVDPELSALARGIAQEGLKVVENPGILDPVDFVNCVLHERLPNAAIPDTPQRIAADTSQKLPIRFGGTVQRYLRCSQLDAAKLVFIPLVFAGWCRYLLGVDDAGHSMTISPDPMVPRMAALLGGITVGQPASLTNQLVPILSNADLFGEDLYQIGLGRKTEEMLRSMLVGPNAVRTTLRRFIGA